VNVESVVIAALEADAGVGGVVTLLTGGVYSFVETGRLGISRTSTPGAFDADGLLKPCAVVKARGAAPDGGADDDGAQVASYRQVVEVWLYADGDAAQTTIEAAQKRAFTVLHGKMIGSDKVIAHWAGNYFGGERDASLDFALVLRCDYAVRAMI